MKSKNRKKIEKIPDFSRQNPKKKLLTLQTRFKSSRPIPDAIFGRFRATLKGQIPIILIILVQKVPILAQIYPIFQPGPKIQTGQSGRGPSGGGLCCQPQTDTCIGPPKPPSDHPQHHFSKRGRVRTLFFRPKITCAYSRCR